MTALRTFWHNLTDEAKDGVTVACVMVPAVILVAAWLVGG